MSLRLARLLPAAVLAMPAALAQYSFDDARKFLVTYCRACHEGKTAVGGFRIERVGAEYSLRSEGQRWTKLAARVHASEMPPKNAPAPGIEERERFLGWVASRVREEACAAGMVPGPSPIRRLNRDEYANTLRDLLDMHLDLASQLPADGAGGEGFDNAAETLFLSPILAEKYMDAAKFAMDFAAKEFKSRNKIFTAQPGGGVSAEAATRRILQNFLPRAFRRPVDDGEVASYLGLYQTIRKQGQAHEPAVLTTLRAVLVSPHFLFRVVPPNPNAQARRMDSFALASRVSYFLWGSMPDEFLFDIAAEGKLHEPGVLAEVIPRMLRNDRALGFFQSFAEQWLHTRELTGEKTPDAKLFPAYATDEELRGDIRFQPILFLREVFARNLSLVNLIDSDHTIATSNLTKHFNLELPLNPAQRKQPQWVALPPGSRRGGMLGMPAVLAVSSYPYRTSPVLRGAWILDSLLGTPPPPPPPDVPALEDGGNPAAAKSMRERLAQHRANAVCASCHSRIDGLGFALENYDVIGRWRDEDAGQKIDSSAEMAGGVTFQGPDGLRKILRERKDLVIRNFTSRMLGYALGRGLTLTDQCTVDHIMAKLRDNDYKAQTLVEGILLSEPFQAQAAAIGVQKEQKKQ